MVRDPYGSAKTPLKQRPAPQHRWIRTLIMMLILLCRRAGAVVDRVRGPAWWILSEDMPARGGSAGRQNPPAQGTKLCNVLYRNRYRLQPVEMWE